MAISHTCTSDASLTSRGINEGRQAARDVDTFLMGPGTQLPRTGGIIQRAPYEVSGKMEASGGAIAV